VRPPAPASVRRARFGVLAAAGAIVGGAATAVVRSMR
jgi:hypothetical protein